MCKLKCIRVVFTVSALIGSTLLSACREEGEGVVGQSLHDDTGASTGVAGDGGTSSIDSGTGESSEADPGHVANAIPVNVQYPQDTALNDRPGMIIKGLNGQDPSAATASRFVHTLTFRIDSNTPGSGDAHAMLFHYSPDLTVDHVADFYEIALDTCKLDSEPDTTHSADANSGAAPLSVSGGQSITINSMNGAWFTLPLSVSEQGDVIYATNNGLPGALPAAAYLSIPGDNFPGIERYSLFEPEPPTRLLPALDKPVSTESFYTWVPDPRKGSVKINVLAFDAQNVFLGYKASCTVKDDGSFTMPQKILDLIASSPDQLSVRYSRVYNRLDLINDVLFFQEAEVTE